MLTILYAVLVLAGKMPGHPGPFVAVGLIDCIFTPLLLMIIDVSVVDWVKTLGNWIKSWFR